MRAFKRVAGRGVARARVRDMETVNSPGFWRSRIPCFSRRSSVRSNSNARHAVRIVSQFSVFLRHSDPRCRVFRHPREESIPGTRAVAIIQRFTIEIIANGSSPTIARLNPIANCL